MYNFGSYWIHSLNIDIQIIFLSFFTMKKTLIFWHM